MYRNAERMKRLGFKMRKKLNFSYKNTGKNEKIRL